MLVELLCCLAYLPSTQQTTIHCQKNKSRFLKLYVLYSVPYGWFPAIALCIFQHRAVTRSLSLIQLHSYHLKKKNCNCLKSWM